MGKLKEYMRETSYLSSGLEFSLSVLIGMGIGYILDRWLKTFPIMTILWLVLGFVAGIRSLYRKVNQ